MIRLRAQKVANVADDVPPQLVQGPDHGKLLVVSWGGTFGACRTAVESVQGHGSSVAHLHLRYLNPLPKDLGDILGRYDRLLVPELNEGQLHQLLRATYLADPVALNKVQGKPFAVVEIVRTIKEILA
jgi:2-oxoglutarate ferredoxin oxidoreductase subunit alpha